MKGEPRYSMKSFRFAILLFATLNSALADSAVRVAASRDLALAVVAVGRASAERTQLHETFARCFRAAVAKQCGADVGLQQKPVGADHAAFNLGTGVYDAALFIGRTLPEPLRKVDATVLSALPDKSRPDRKVHLLVGNGDPGLQAILAGAFSTALHDERMLAGLSGTAPVAPSRSASVAAN